MAIQDDFVVYAKRYAKTYHLSFRQIKELKLVREVGLSYGLTDLEIDDLFKSHFGV